jgi:GH25 family lysozyme M1 (1,4-beta-N-acetylmuramidase)
VKISGPLVVDVSLYDHHLNIQELLDGGVVSVILGLYRQWKSGVATLHDNCKRIIDQISPSPLILQTYKYYYPQEDPIKDADWFVDTMKEYPVKFAWADLEEHGSVMSQKLRSEQNRRFTAQLYSRFTNVGVYTRKSYVEEYAPEMDLWLGKYPTWVAHYGRGPMKNGKQDVQNISWKELKANWLPDYPVLVPSGAKKFVGHQFTGSNPDIGFFRLPGVYNQYAPFWPNGGRMALDISVFTPQFIDSIGNASNQPPTPLQDPQPTPSADYVVVPAAINVRSGPASTYKLIGIAKCGDILQVTPVRENGYAKLTNDTWVYAAYLKIK